MRFADLPTEILLEVLPTKNRALAKVRTGKRSASSCSLVRFRSAEVRKGVRKGAAGLNSFSTA